MTAETELFKTADTRCWHAVPTALVLSLEQSRPAISSDVLDALDRAIIEAERGFATLVITSAGEHFGFGANLDPALAAAEAGDAQLLSVQLDRYQQVMLRLRHAAVPTIAAVRGVAVSGACELLMHVTRVVAHPKSRIGLAESSMGVVPSGGGLKEFALRAARAADSRAQIEHAFATVAASIIATQARELGYLAAEDRVNAADPLAEAIELGLGLHAAGHVPPPPHPTFPGAGRELLEEWRAAQARLLADGALLPHQFEVNVRLAHVLCGEVPAGALRSEAELLALERQHFVILAPMPLSVARRVHYRNTRTLLQN
jgi:3-hydroxyacyl-CoA dehydrogenase